MPHIADQPIGLGCMRLSTARDRDEALAIRVLHAAFDLGITFLDTADAYALDASETGHNERLIARAIAAWPGALAQVRVATKGGLTRPRGAWVADGRARHLVAACEASRRALGVDRIDLYQLHAPDPRVPLATSVRALASLKRDGLIASIGLCNVTVGQIEEARRITEIDAVQVELSLWHDEAVLSGVVEHCLDHGIRVIAYRPVSGPQNRRRVQTDPVLAELAARHDASPFEIALAWLHDISALVVPIPGATRVETVHSIAHARTIALNDEDRARLVEAFPAARALRVRRHPPAPLPARHTAVGEVVLIMGLPGAGKSTLAEALVAQGYQRLNRDETGGSLTDLLPVLDRAIVSGDGESRIVLDNTYVSRKSRAAVIQTAQQRGLGVRCVWLSTNLEDAQVNAATRIVSRYGRLLAMPEIARARKDDVAAFLPTVQFRYQRELEPPDPAEGFSRIDVVPFERRQPPAPDFVNRAVIVWCDGVLTRSRSGKRVPSSADDMEVFAERGAVLRRYQDDGWRVLGLSWQPEIADAGNGNRIENANANDVTVADVDAAFARMRELLGIAIEVEYCPHAAGPPTCWCRKPLPGLGVLFVQRHRLDASQCLYVAAGPQDPGFARRLGFQFRHADEFFAAPPRDA